jgi:hypothetical protein
MTGRMGLVFRAWWELAAYDVVYALRGFRGVRARLTAPAKDRVGSASVEGRVCEAVTIAACFYWRPVLCLQRSVCTTRLLRVYGIQARTVIGYRRAPFLSHAWVEVAGQVVNDSPLYRQQMHMLDAM